MPLMPWAASPSAMARTSSGCILVKSATWSKVSAVLSTSHTAVAFGISGALLMANLLCASPTSFWRRSLRSSVMTGIRRLYTPSRGIGAMVCYSALTEPKSSPKSLYELAVPCPPARGDSVLRDSPMPATSAQPDLKIVLCSPRGFCAGAVRAIDTVERALAIYGAPVYVRHEIVHNRYVVDSLKTKGAIFVEELAEIPDNTNAPVVFSAHGVPKSVPADAKARNFFSLDATCPLVTKVHREAAIHFKRGREILLIGHSHHPEVVGTLGQLPPGAVTLIETAEDAK